MCVNVSAGAKICQKWLMCNKDLLTGAKCEKKDNSWDNGSGSESRPPQWYYSEYRKLCQSFEYKVNKRILSKTFPISCIHMLFFRINNDLLIVLMFSSQSCEKICQCLLGITLNVKFA